eukprot:scaffold28624_cov62-Phaeocystis_antarctica.AAC.5
MSATAISWAVAPSMSARTVVTPPGAPPTSSSRAAPARLRRPRASATRDGREGWLAAIAASSPLPLARPQYVSTAMAASPPASVCVSNVLSSAARSASSLAESNGYHAEVDAPPAAGSGKESTSGPSCSSTSGSPFCAETTVYPVRGIPPVCSGGSHSSVGTPSAVTAPKRGGVGAGGRRADWTVTANGEPLIGVLLRSRLISTSYLPEMGYVSSTW